MKITETAKDIVGLIQQLGNLDLSKRIVDLQSQIIDLVEENHGLKEKIRSLRDHAAKQENLEVRKNSYWLGDDGPLCTRCWDAEALLLRLNVRAGYTPLCPKCNTCASDPDQPPPAPISGIGRHSPWS